MLRQHLLYTPDTVTASGLAASMLSREGKRPREICGSGILAQEAAVITPANTEAMLVCFDWLPSRAKTSSDYQNLLR